MRSIGSGTSGVWLQIDARTVEIALRNGDLRRALDVEAGESVVLRGVARLLGSESAPAEPPAAPRGRRPSVPEESADWSPAALDELLLELARADWGVVSIHSGDHGTALLLASGRDLEGISLRNGPTTGSRPRCSDPGTTCGRSHRPACWNREVRDAQLGRMCGELAGTLWAPVAEWLARKQVGGSSCRRIAGSTCCRSAHSTTWPRAHQRWTSSS